MQVNVVGRMLCAKDAVEAMSTAPGGRGGCIVNIAGIFAQAPAWAMGAVPTEATKGALVTFARGLSNEVAAEGIRVNSVSPGVIDTQLASAETFEAAAEHSPLGRKGRPDERAQTASWLLSSQSSDVTGSDIPVTGGARPGRCRRRPGGRRP